jgi:hypothetical protein
MNIIIVILINLKFIIHKHILFDKVILTMWSLILYIEGEVKTKKELTKNNDHLVSVVK